MPFPPGLIDQIRSNDPAITEVTKCLGGEQEVEELAGALSTNTTILKLDLRYSQLGEHGLAIIAQALRTSNVTQLSLCNCDLVSAHPLTQAFVFSCVVTVLDLRHNDIGDEGAKDLAKAMEQTGCCLVSLSLGHCGITDEGVKHLAVSMAKYSFLHDLDLKGNNIGPEGVEALTMAITHRPGLVSLDLKENMVGNEGAASIAAALSNKNSLTDLNLSDNEIGDDGALMLARSLTINDQMKRLHLNANDIGDSGALEFRRALQYNNTLMYLDLSRNAASKEIRQDIGKLLDGNRRGNRTKKLRQGQQNENLDCTGIVSGILTTISDHGMCGAQDR